MIVNSSCKVFVGSHNMPSRMRHTEHYLLSFRKDNSNPNAIVINIVSFLQNICYHERKLSVEPLSVSIACLASLQQPIGKMSFC